MTHDGRIIYTRWDYVDRYGCTAHLPWITTLDGRDSRAVHGNFAPRQSRPDMELDIQRDPRLADVTWPRPRRTTARPSARWCSSTPAWTTTMPMAPVKRITPDVGFPGKPGGAEAYGTAWPLSEDYYLCVRSGLPAWPLATQLRPGAASQATAYRASTGFTWSMPSATRS